MTGLGGAYVARVFKPKGQEQVVDAERRLVLMVGSGKVWWRDETKWGRKGATPKDEFDRDWVAVN